MWGSWLIIGLFSAGLLMLQWPVVGAIATVGCLGGLLWWAWRDVDAQIEQAITEHQVAMRHLAEVTCQRREGPWEAIIAGQIERPWRKEERHSAQAMTPEAQAEARARGMAVARVTMGEKLWASYVVRGYVEVPSGLRRGVDYRLRPGMRIEVRGSKGAYVIGYLCVEPAYPMPALEFLGQCVVLLRDAEAEMRFRATPQRRGGSLSKVF